MKQQSNSVTSKWIEKPKKTPNLFFGNNLNCHLLPLQLSLLHHRGASIPKVPAANHFTKLIPRKEVLQEPEVLAQQHHIFTLWNRSLTRLRRRVPPCKKCLDMLGGGWGRERPFEYPQRGWVDTRTSRRVLEIAWQGARHIEWEMRLSRSFRLCCGILIMGNDRVLYLYWVALGFFSMARSHRETRNWIGNDQEL